MRWYRRIQRAKRRGYFTEHDAELAEDWSKCMISERPNTRHFENDPEAEPIGTRLHQWGLDFYNAVKFNWFDEALALRKKILGKERNRP